LDVRRTSKGDTRPEGALSIETPRQAQAPPRVVLRTRELPAPYARHWVRKQPPGLFAALSAPMLEAIAPIRDALALPSRVPPTPRRRIGTQRHKAWAGRQSAHASTGMALRRVRSPTSSCGLLCVAPSESGRAPDVLTSSHLFGSEDELRALVRSRGLEPPRLAALTPQASASTNSATTARPRPLWEPAPVSKPRRPEQAVHRDTLARRPRWPM
jgi:hypothetical protein